MPTTPRYTFRLKPTLVRQVDKAAAKQLPPVTRTQWLREAIVAKLRGRK